MKRTLVLALALSLALPLSIWGSKGRERHRRKAPAAAPLGPSWATASRWSALTAPKAGTAKAIGFYTAGCVQGAVALPPSGPGFELLHMGRQRYFGHPALVAYVRWLAAAAEERGLPVLLVGDLSQPRGGPTPSDHGSHQSGLDVDVGYTRPKDALSRPLDAAARESLSFTPVVDLASGRFSENWDPRIVSLLELAASNPAVDRVFVNPTIKRELCTLEAPGTPWLMRLRPWWGHHDHFHVRLKCPIGSAECRHQAPPSDDACGDALAWWFSDEARAAAEKGWRSIEPVGRRRSPLPARCRELLR